MAISCVKDHKTQRRAFAKHRPTFLAPVPPPKSSSHLSPHRSMPPSSRVLSAHCSHQRHHQLINRAASTVNCRASDISHITPSCVQVACAWWVRGRGRGGGGGGGGGWGSLNARWGHGHVNLCRWPGGLQHSVRLTQTHSNKSCQACLRAAFIIRSCC